MRLRSGFVNPINLVMLGIGIFAGLMSAWWLFPIGLVFWLIMVVMVARDPGTKIREGISDRPQVATRFQKVTDRISRAQVRLYNTIQQTGTQQQRVLQPLMGAANAMADQAFNLAQRMTIIENHRIVSDSPAEILDQINAAKMELVLKDDLKVKQEQESILRSLESRLQKVKDLENILDRAESQLKSMLTELENSLTEVVRMQTMEPGEMREPIRYILDELSRESLEAAEFKFDISN